MSGSSPSSDRPPIAIRLAAWITGAAVLLWLPVEDTDVLRPVGLAATMSAVLAIHLHHRTRPTDPCQGIFVRYPLLGGLAGLATPCLAVGLMIFKSGLHGHGFPDFQFSQIAQVLRGIPVWTLAGLAIGSAWALRHWTRCTS